MGHGGPGASVAALALSEDPIGNLGFFGGAAFVTGAKRESALRGTRWVEHGASSILFNARISALLVTGKVEAAALKTSFAAETLLHVYNTTWQRLDGTVSMELLQACRNQEEAEQYIRSRALPCTPVPIHIHKVWSAKAAAVPLSCAANGQQGTVASLDLMAAIAQRRKCSREETVLRGLPPGPSLCTVPAEVLGQGVIAPLLHNLHRHRQLAITDDLSDWRTCSGFRVRV